MPPRPVTAALTQTTLTSRQSALIRKLVKSRGALFWQRGFWHMAKASGEPPVRLSVEHGQMVDVLRDAGTLVEQPDGSLRIGNFAAKPRVNIEESPLARLYMVKDGNGRTYLDDEQFRAGERLRQDHERARLAPRVTASYQPAEGTGSRHWQMSDNGIECLTISALTARQHLHAAFAAVGPELSGILFHVCCLAGGLEQAELRLALPRRSGKAVLALALTRLARHYGLKQRLSHGGTARIGHWAVEGFRPSIPASGP